MVCVCVCVVLLFILDRTCSCAGCHPGGAAALGTGCLVIIGSVYVTISSKLKMCFEVLVTAQQRRALFMCSCCLWLCSHSCCCVIELVLAQCSSEFLAFLRSAVPRIGWEVWGWINLCCFRLYTVNES